MTTNPPALLDGYKVDHRRQYPENSRIVFSNLTARGSRVTGVNHVVFFGLQYFLKKYLIQEWNTSFFSKPKEEVVAKFKRRIDTYLGPNQVGAEHIEALHDLGHLPLCIMALPEGTHVPVRVPMMVMWNTNPDFFWLTNAIETILSTSIWMPCTSATTAAQYRNLLDHYANETDKGNTEFVPWQGHDFSFRGHAGLEAASMSGAGHLLSFTGTDTLPAIDFLEEYYGADAEKELVGGSVAATEHSVMCMGSREGEVETFRRLIEDVYPEGIISIVSDTWNFWEVINVKDGILVQLKDKVLARNGKLVIRPDSGDPVKITAGYKIRYADSDIESENLPSLCASGFEVVGAEGKFYMLDKDQDTYLGKEISHEEAHGLVRCLWEIFGGERNDQGFINLDPHIGAIYGDSITLERAREICERLKYNGFASTNVVFGIGSFTYQGAIEPNAIVTRDTYGFAVKSTYGEVRVDVGDGEWVQRGVEIFKDPVTDDGLKKSAKGITSVFRDERHPDKPLTLHDQSTWEALNDCEFQQVFVNGKLYNEQNLTQIRETIANTSPYTRK